MSNLRITRRRVLQGVGAVGVLGALGGRPTAVLADERAAGGTRVRWDTLHLDFGTTPQTFRPGGVDYASADPTMRIKLTGSGTFVAPSGGGISHAVTGGGTWETFEGAMSTGSGTFEVTALASWQFANMQAQTPPFIDLIGDVNQRANGNAVLTIAYSDGSRGTLGIGCMGPGAPMGIQEGVIATKGYTTYWTREAPAPGVDKDRTIFHILHEGHEGGEED